MNACTLLFIAFVMLLFVAMFPSLNRSAAVDAWIERAATSGGSLLFELAQTSTTDALLALAKGVGIVGAILLVISLITNRLVEPAVHATIQIAGISLLWCTLSIKAWITKGPLALEQAAQTMWHESKSKAVGFTIFALAVLLATVGVMLWLTGSVTNDILPLLTLIVSGLLSLVLSIIVVNTAPLLIAFGPAWLVLVYIYTSISFASILYKLGKGFFVNVMIIGAWIGTVYFTAISFPVLRDSMHLIPICG